MHIKKIGLSLTAVAAVVVFGTQSANTQSMPDWGPKFNDAGELILPTGFHEWVFLGSPLTPNGLNDGAANFPEYHNVYIQPEAYHAFRKTGKWADGTIMLKELQLSQPGVEPDGSSYEPSGRGYFPSVGNGIDIAVKDSTKYAETNDWAYFNFGHHAKPYEKTASALPRESCADCHVANATDMVFIKFYRNVLDAE